MFLSVQLEYLLFLQNLRDLTGNVFTGFFSCVTHLGEILIPTLIMAGIYWCINNKAGIYILWNSAFGFLANMILKMSACIYRPWMLDSRIKPVPSAITMATGYSFPSGHTAGATSIFGSIAVKWWNNKLIRYSMIAIVLLVAFSRNYLGVHTPQDVLVSLLVGTFFLWFTLKLTSWVEKDKNRDIIFTVIISIVSIVALLYANYKSYPINYVNGHILIDPIKIKYEAFTKTGYVLGVFWGWIIERRFINFDASVGSKVGKIIRFIIGSFGIAIILNYTKILWINLLGAKIGHFAYTFGFTFFITAFYPMLIKIFYNLKKQVVKAEE